MKRMVKPVIAVTLAAAMLAGCSGGSKEDKKSGSGDKVTITYASWNLGTEEENNLERRMIAAYEEEHENVTIEIVDSISAKDYRNSMTTAAAAGKLPDVFMVDNVPYASGNDWLYDVSKLTEKDEDFKKISEPVRESAKVDGKTMVIPAGQYLAGYFVNTELFEAENVKQPQIGYSLSDLDKAVKSMTKLNQGMMGLANEQNLIEWYPNLIDKKLQWYTFDGKEFHLNSDAFKQAIVKAQEYAKNNSFDALDQEQKEEFSGLTEMEAWLAGDIAMYYGGTWLANDFQDASFEYEFIGLPDKKNVIVNDYMGISKETKHAEEAYDFAKWMSFSKEGMEERIDLCEEDNLIWASLPIINDEDLNDKYFEWNEIKGVKEAYANLDNSIVENTKTLPGYSDARYDAKTGVQIETKENATIGDLIYLMIRNGVNPDDYLDQINKLANDSYKKALKGAAK